MKTLKTRQRPTPEETLRAVSSHAPSLPPTLSDAPDRATTLNLRLRHSTVFAIVKAARERGMTIKQLIAQAISLQGISIAPEDLEDRTPRRRDM